MTGSNGTVGTALARVLRERGDEVIGWDRAVAPPADRAACERLVREIEPEAVVHLAVASSGTGIDNEGAIVSIDWSEQLATLCRDIGATYLFTSTAMVFTNDARGPFTIDSEPDAADGYGGEKRLAEGKVLSANPDAAVVRLGWQIGEAPGSNNMIDFMANAMKNEGVVRASRKWKPATSFLGDTANALAWLLDRAASRELTGVSMIDGNRAGHSFFDIVSALSAQKHGGAFTIEADDSFVYDQRMIDERIPVVQLQERLELPKPARVDD
jgi:dTDP-4-dehydrorhamnose reductase